MEFNWKLEEGIINLHMQIGKNSIKIFTSRGELMTVYVFIDTNQLSYLEKNTKLGDWALVVLQMKSFPSIHQRLRLEWVHLI